MSTQYTSSQIDLSLVPTDAQDQERMKTLIEVLSAYVEYFHGGRLEMVSFDGETLQVRMLGACQGCNLQQVTLHGWIEGTVRPFFPDLHEVVAVS